MSSHVSSHRTYTLPMITTPTTWLTNALRRELITQPHNKLIGCRSSHHHDPPVNVNRWKLWSHGELNGNWRVWVAMIHPVSSRSWTCSLNYGSAFLNGRKQQTWEYRKPYYNEIIVRHFRSCAGAETVKQITERRTVWIILIFYFL